MNLLQDMKDLISEYDTLVKQEKEDPSINNANSIQDIQQKIFMLTTKQNQEIYSLVERLNYYRDKYYNNEPIVSDTEYDNLFFELAELERQSGIVLDNSPTLFPNFLSVKQIEKVEHNYKLGHIKKTWDLQEVNNFIQDNQTTIITPQIDGVTCFLHYNSGYLSSAITYGNGIVGKDITHNVLTMAPIIPRRIPEKKDIIIEGKIVCLFNNFNLEFLQKFQTPYNLVADSIKLLDSKDFANRHLSFIAENLVTGFEEISYQRSRIQKMAELGFAIIPNVIINESLTEEMIELLQDMANRRLFTYSGIICKNNFFNIKTENLLEYHNKIIIYNIYQKKYNSTLRNIIWSITDSNNLLIPTAIFNTVVCNKEKIRTAQLFNIKTIQTIFGDSPYQGQNIEFYKVNGIIPQICKAEKLTINNNTTIIQIPEKCPFCGQKLSRKNYITNGPYLECHNEQCSGILINRVKRFCSKDGVNILTLANNEKLLQTLIEQKKVTCLTDIYALSRFKKEWIASSFLTNEEINTLIDEIEKSKECTLAQFLYGINIPGINQKEANFLAQYFKTYNTFQKAIVKLEKYADKTSVLIENHIKEMLNNILNFDYSEANKLYSHLKQNNLEEILALPKNYFYMPLRKKTYVVVGPVKYFDSVEWLCGYIHGEGGAVITQVTENVNYVINNDPESDCPENIAARELGIPIITEQEFLDNIY